METQIKSELQNTCGIKKIIDCKVENGQQMYKVKWEPTWEPAENLVTCQHLVDEFWSYVNQLKSREKVALQQRNLINSNYKNHANNRLKSHSLTDDNKLEIQQMISRTSQSEVGTLLSPSNTFQSASMSSSNTNSLSNASSPSNLKTLKTDPSVGPSPLIGKGTIAASSLKYLEGFDNPYVKLIVACKICNREQTMKHAHSWKQHYLTHSDQKPHNCSYCSKGFLRTDQLRNHIKKHHPNSTQQETGTGMNMKSENY